MEPGITISGSQLWFVICCGVILKCASKKENSSGHRKHNMQRPGGKKVPSCSGNWENSHILELKGQILKGLNSLLRDLKHRTGENARGVSSLSWFSLQSEPLKLPLLCYLTTPWTSAVAVWWRSVWRVHASISVTCPFAIEGWAHSVWYLFTVLCPWRSGLSSIGAGALWFVLK